MPVFDFFHWTQQTGSTLQESGPLIPVSIGLPPALEEFFAQNGIEIPAPISGYALIYSRA